MSNIIEEFVIKFLTDSKEAKKGANDLDKFLESVGKKQVKRDEKLVKSEKDKRKVWEDSQKRKAKTQKEMEALRIKQEENLKEDFDKRVALYKKEKREKDRLGGYSNLSRSQREQAAIEKAISDRQDKELKREMDLAKLQKNTSAAKKASEVAQRKEMFKTRKHILDSYGKENKEIKDMRDYYKSLEKQSAVKPSDPIGQLSATPQQKRKRWVDKQKRRAANRRQREDDRREEEDSYRQSLNKRLQAFKASKQKERKFSEAIENQEAMIRRTAGFKLAGRMGESGKYDKEIQRLVDNKDLEGLRKLRYEMTDVRENMIRYRKSLRKTNIAQKGLTDSTRNMIRSYASLYAIFEGTSAIKRVGMSFQGMEASMLAASGSSEAAAKDMMFINGIVDEMGLSLKDTTDAFVKFKFASKGKISQTEQEDLFTGLSMFGTALKVDDESMKRSQKALIQIDDYCLAA